MSYVILGQNLHETADRAKEYFSNQYGAQSFKCEQAVEIDLPLKPTWQAKLPGGYNICVDVRESPFSQTLYEFVLKCANRGLPIRLWVVVPYTAAAPTFNAELKQAHEFGVGVVEINENGNVHEYHRPVAFSLFALKATELERVPRKHRDYVKSAESTFRDGSPDQGCQAICQALEDLTRKFAQHTYGLGYWKQPQGAKVLDADFFETKPWAGVLKELEERADSKKIHSKAAAFTKQAIVRARAHTDWRNAVSHKPKTFDQMMRRDAKLRTMYESTRDLLIEWYGIAKPFKLDK